MKRYRLYRTSTIPKRIRNCSGIPSLTNRPLNTRTPTTAMTTDMLYPTRIETDDSFSTYFPCSLNRNGMETHTETGPFFIMAGVKIHCMAASVAGWLKISASLF